MFLAGQFITALRLNRLQDEKYYAKSSANLPASQTNIDIPGCFVTFTTETDGAEIDVEWVTHFDLSGAITSAGTSRISVTGPSPATSDVVAVYAAEVATDTSTVPAQWTTTLPIAGTYTVKVQGTTPANMIIGPHTTVKVTVREIV